VKVVAVRETLLVWFDLQKQVGFCVDQTLLLPHVALFLSTFVLLIQAALRLSYLDLFYWLLEVNLCAIKGKSELILSVLQSFPASLLKKKKVQGAHIPDFYNCCRHFNYFLKREVQMLRNLLLFLPEI
jgi:hypothetical protein